MFNLLKSKNKEKKEGNFFAAITKGLKKTRESLSEGLGNLFLGKKVVDGAFLEEIETHLLLADVGIDVTAKVIVELTRKISRKELDEPSALFSALKKQLLEFLLAASKPPPPLIAKPSVILIIGVNGNGKTTTIGKLAHHFQYKNKKVMLAAGDTFRAAAVEQLKIWGERNNIATIAQNTGADSASVIFDAYKAAIARDIDILLVDTAGRLHTQKHLMDELKKIKRVLGKIDSAAPHETWLVLDCSNGQNALRQAQEFHNSLGVTGIILTKLDGTAKGGIVFAIAQELKLPIYYIGVGEKIEDLLPFDPNAFVTALFEK